MPLCWHIQISTQDLEWPITPIHRMTDLENQSCFQIISRARITEIWTSLALYSKQLKLPITDFIHPHVIFLNLGNGIQVPSRTFYMEKAMAPHSSTLAWKTPWKEEPGGLPSMGSLRVEHDWATSLSLFTFMHWRRKWQPTPVFLPGESQGWRSLVGCHLWGLTELDMTEAT